MRQELPLTYQRIHLQSDVYELHARIALEMADLGEIYQCQIAATSAVSLNLGGHPSEFWLIVSYTLFIPESHGFETIYGRINFRDKETPPSSMLWKLGRLLASGNYHRLFVSTLTCPTWALTWWHVCSRERLLALDKICKALVQCKFSIGH